MMRVLNTVTGQFLQINPRPTDRNSKLIKYAILSHTWDSTDEHAFQQLRAIQKQYNIWHYLWDDDITPWFHGQLPAAPDELFGYIQAFSPKIWHACKVARENGYQYLWMDFCCIDRTSSSEISESINSMYEWYAFADVCYAFLADVAPTSAARELHANSSSFRSSRWFTRSWTLQELIAPFNVVFLANDWTAIGSKFVLGKVIAEITKIDYDALLHIEPLESFSVAQRISWAARRKATKVEDRAYSLLGILDVSMPTLYGEGELAFRRLQEEIMRRTPDQSLFAWTAYGLPRSSSDTLPYNPETSDIQKYVRNPLILDYDDSVMRSSLLATSPDTFKQCDGIRALSNDEVLRRLHLTADDLPPRQFEFTPYGLRIPFPVIQLESSKYFPPGLVIPREFKLPECPSFSQWYLVILGCEHREFPGRLLGRVCYIQSSEANVDFLYSGFIGHDESTQSDLVPVSPNTIQRVTADSLALKTLYIPQPSVRDKGVSDYGLGEPHTRIYLVLPKKNQDALSAHGYTATLEPQGQSPYDAPAAHSVTLIHQAHTITIEYQHTLVTDSLTVKASVTILTHGHRPDNPGFCQWTDIGPQWRPSLGPQEVVLTAQRLTLSLSLAFFKTNYYCLSIELNPSSSIHHL